MNETPQLILAQEVFGMRPGRRAIITGPQREERWRRYKAGQTILGIGRALGQRPTTIHRVLKATGGIGPAQRDRRPGGTDAAEPFLQGARARSPSNPRFRALGVPPIALSARSSLTRSGRPLEA
jgi:hypothetical protein